MPKPRPRTKALAVQTKGQSGTRLLLAWDTTWIISCLLTVAEAPDTSNGTANPMDKGQSLHNISVLVYLISSAENVEQSDGRPRHANRGQLMRAILDNLEPDDELNVRQSNRRGLKRRTVESDDEGNQDAIPADTPLNPMAPPVKRRRGTKASLLSVFTSHLVLRNI